MEEGSAEIDGLPWLHASSRDRVPFALTIGLVSHCGTALCWCSALQAPPMPFPHARAGGHSSPGLLLGDSEKNGNPEGQEKPLGGHQAALVGCSHLNTSGGNPRAPISFKRG